MEKSESKAETGSVEDLLNEAILHVDISMEGLVIIHDPTAFDQKPVALQRKKMGGQEENYYESYKYLILLELLPKNKYPSVPGHVPFPPREHEQYFIHSFRHNQAVDHPVGLPAQQNKAQV